MGYTGLFTTEAIFVLVIALWFVRQLDWFSFLERIKDPKGILPPTITLLVGFIVIPNIVNFYNSLSKDNVILELLKSSTPLIAIFTFFLGQFTAIREKERDRKEQKKITAYKMLDSLDWLISNGGSLYCIEKKLEQAKPKDFDYSKFQSFCENQLIEIDSQLKEAQANEETFTIANERFFNWLF